MVETDGTLTLTPGKKMCAAELSPMRTGKYPENRSKNKKRPVTLPSHGTPEQPSPRTAHVQDRFSRVGCKSHIRANDWHEIAMRDLYLPPAGC